MDENESSENIAADDSGDLESRSDSNVDLTRNISLPPEMECEVSKLKGDAIGDTLYSEGWVLRHLMVLLEFTPEKMSGPLENDLCLLWDMTVEKDVMKFLLKHDFYTIAVQCFKLSVPFRITEIVVGIIGNMCQIAEARRELAQHTGLHSALLDLLSSSDSHVLQQLMRLLNTCIWHLNKTDDNMFNEGLCSWLVSNKETLNQRLAFILASSLSDELLYCTMELVHNLCSVSIGNESVNVQFATSEMLDGLLEAVNTLVNALEKDEDVKPIWTSEMEKAMEHWAVILDIFAQCEPGIILLSDNCDELVDAFVCVLSSLGESESPRILNQHRWQLLGSLANTLHCLGEHNGFAPPSVLPLIIRLLPRLPKLPQGTESSASFEDEYEEVGDDEVEEFVEVHINIVRYCVVALSVLDTEDLVEAFNKYPSINVAELQLTLQRSADADFQKVAKLMLSTNLVE